MLFRQQKVKIATKKWQLDVWQVTFKLFLTNKNSKCDWEKNSLNTGKQNEHWILLKK